MPVGFRVQRVALESFRVAGPGSEVFHAVQRLDRPLRIIGTLDHSACVRPNGYGHEMRILQPTELESALVFVPLTTALQVALFAAESYST